MRYTVTLEDGTTFEMDKGGYEFALAEFDRRGRTVIDGNSVTGTDKPKFRAIEDYEERSKAIADTFDEGVSDERKTWNVTILKLSAGRIANGLPVIPYAVIQHVRDTRFYGLECDPEWVWFWTVQHLEEPDIAALVPVRFRIKKPLVRDVLSANAITKHGAEVRLGDAAI